MKGIEIEVFDLLDQHIEKCLEDDAAEKALIQMYWDWWKELKETNGYFLRFYRLIGIYFLSIHFEKHRTPDRDNFR